MMRIQRFNLRLRWLKPRVWSERSTADSGALVVRAKAIVILLTLLALGVKGIYTGPTAPAFLTPNLMAILQQQFDLRSITTAEDDLRTILAA